MFDTPIVEVIIGLVFVYALLSLICSAISESVAGMFKIRARTLREAVTRLLQEDDKGVGEKGEDGKGKSLVDTFYEHPLIRGLMKKKLMGKGKYKDPSYIPARAFAQVLLNLDDVRKALGGRPSEPVNDKSKPAANEVAKALRALGVSSPNVSDEMRKNIEDWFNDTMDRAAGWYKRKAQWIVLGFACLVTIAANADTIMMAQTLWRDPAVRAKISKMAEQAAQQPIPEGEDASREGDWSKVHAEIKSLDLIGWSRETNDPRAWPTTKWGIGSRVIGWLMTIVAVSLGAPFWFDLLSRFIKLRATGTRLPTGPMAGKDARGGEGERPSRRPRRGRASRGLRME